MVVDDLTSNQYLDISWHILQELRLGSFTPQKLWLKVEPGRDETQANITDMPL